MRSVETDYLVLGAGATGMAFVDALIAESEANVVMVDRRSAPGGHWNDAYPFVRLHQPSAIYGVNSVNLGHDRIDESGLNAGYYEQASGSEIAEYFRHVLDKELLPSEQVTFFGGYEHVGEDGHGHRLVSSSGEEVMVAARKVVDATYLHTELPATHPPGFEIDPGARVVTPTELVALIEDGTPGAGFTVIGAGKTAADTCTWLLQQGVAHDDVRWVRPRDAWFLDRAFTQPLDLVAGMVEGLAAVYLAAARAETLDELYVRAEEADQIMRLDREVEPGMCHGATLSRAELELLQGITNVVRMGHVRRVGVSELALDEGTIATRQQEVHVNCTARGLGWARPKPIFGDDRITPQGTRYGMLPFCAALAGFLETTGRSNQEKNRLSRPNPVPRLGSRLDWAWGIYLSGVNDLAWRGEPDIQAWLKASRLNIGRAIPEHLDDSRVQSAVANIASHGRDAVGNLRRLLDDDFTNSG
jgi:diadenosine tetraphosphatase ApaH/serine/threonine PP2A family protein phosphatase